MRKNGCPRVPNYTLLKNAGDWHFLFFPHNFSSSTDKLHNLRKVYLATCECFQYKQEHAPPGWLSGERVGLKTWRL